MAKDCDTPQKVVYSSGLEAAKVAKSMRRGGRNIGLGAYQCPAGHWHVGHSNRRIGYVLGKRTALPGQRRKKN